MPGTRRKTIREMREHHEQASYFRFVRLQLAPKFPELKKLIFAVPNGGFRIASEAVRFEAEGVTPGVGDVLVSVPSFVTLKERRKKYLAQNRAYVEEGYFARSEEHLLIPALYLEFKDPQKGQKDNPAFRPVDALDPEQVIFRDEVLLQGYRYEVVFDWISAARETLEYLSIRDRALWDILALNTKRGEPL